MSLIKSFSRRVERFNYFLGSEGSGQIQHCQILQVKLKQLPFHFLRSYWVLLVLCWAYSINIFIIFVTLFNFITS